MGEIKITRVKSNYGDLKGLLSQLPLEKEKRFTERFTVDQINQVLDTLSIVAETDYSMYKIPENQADHDWHELYPTSIVRAQLGRVIARLEEEYEFNRVSSNNAPSIVILNKNENEIALRINYTISDLAKKYPDEESKSKLTQLNEELEKPNKNWDTIKGILLWILNFSKDLFLEVIPIILQKRV